MECALECVCVCVLTSEEVCVEQEEAAVETGQNPSQRNTVQETESCEHSSVEPETHTHRDTHIHTHTYIHTLTHTHTRRITINLHVRTNTS